MKIVMITDLHMGVHNNSEAFLKSQLVFFYDVLIPYLEEHNLKHIFILGDIFDNRNSINTLIFNKVFKLFNDLNKYEIHVLVGNHDSYLKSSIKIHSLQFLKKFHNVTVYDDIELLILNNKKILLVPWQTDHDLFIQRVNNNNILCDICMGHFDIQGFKLNNKKINEEGLHPSFLYDNYRIIFSGHFHTRSRIDRKDSVIQYIGNPYQLTKIDMYDNRGFCVLDLNDLSYRFVDNTLSSRFVSIKYPEPVEEYLIKNNFVDLEIEYCQSYKENVIQAYIQQIESLNPAVPVNINTTNFEINNEPKILQSKTLMSLMDEYIDTLNIDNKTDIYNKIETLYNEVKGDKEILI